MRLYARKYGIFLLRCVCLSVCLFVSLLLEKISDFFKYIPLTVCLSVCLLLEKISDFFKYIPLTVCLSVCMFVCLFVCPPPYLPQFSSDLHQNWYTYYTKSLTGKFWFWSKSVNASWRNVTSKIRPMLKYREKWHVWGLVIMSQIKISFWNLVCVLSVLICISDKNMTSPGDVMTSQ